jgi:hypothetical protein
LLNGRVADNEDDILDLQNTRLIKSGDTMTGVLNMGANDLKVTSIVPVSTSITAKTTQFIIDGEDNDCSLIIKADSKNNDENKNPKIIFVQDGSFEEGAIFMGDNTLNISNSASASSINFRCGTNDNAWESAPIRASIDGVSGDLTLDHRLKLPLKTVFTSGVVTLGCGNWAGSKLPLIGTETKSSVWESEAASEGSFIAINGDTIIMSSPCDIQSLNYYDEDTKARIWHITAAGALVVGSDLKIKENIEPLCHQDCLDKILNIDLITYNKKPPNEESKEKYPDKYNKVHTGFSAQSIQANFPDAVDTSDDILAVDTMALLTIALEAIQCLVKRVKMLEALNVNTH